MVNPFLTPVGGSRRQFTQPQNQFDFSGWGDRLGKIEEGIASLTEQFNNFQTPGDVAPEYTGNAAPEPLEQTANAPEPLGGIESLVAEPTPAAPTPMAPQNFNEAQGGQARTIKGPLSLTRKLRNEYLMETKGPLTMGGEWDARAKEMGFDFRKQVRQLEGGEWAGTGQGPDRFNQLFEEAGGVLDRPEMGAAARYGEGFTNWLSGKGYEVYTEPQQEWMTQSQGGLGAFGRDDLGQDTGYIPHLSQYAMTAEEMQDPTGTLKTRRENLYRPSGDVGVPLSEYQLDPVRDAEQIASQQGTTRFGPFDPTALQQIQYQGRPNTQPQQQQALQAGVGALQGWRPEYSLQTQSSLSGPTQQKIQQGLGAGI